MRISDWSSDVCSSDLSLQRLCGVVRMNARPRIAFALLWLAALLLAGWWISAHLQLTGDLRKFMPAPETPEQKLLIAELVAGPGPPLLLVVLSGPHAPTPPAQPKTLPPAAPGPQPL